MAEADDVIVDLFETLRPDDGNAVTGLVEIERVAEALADIPSADLEAGPDTAREAMGRALRRAAEQRAWREGLTGAGLDSPAGRRVLGAVRHAVAALDLAAIVRNVRAARTNEDAERTLAGSLDRIDHDAAAELDRTTPNLLDIYKLPSGALWAIPRDPYGQPLIWERKYGRLAPEPRMSRDRAIANLGEVLGSGFRKPVATFETIPAATAWCRRQPGQGDQFQRALEAERDGEG